MISLDVKQIVGGYNRKEDQATAWIYNTYSRYAYQTIKKITDNCQETADLVSLVFIKLIENENRLGTIRKIREFIKTTSKNIALDHLKKEGRRKINPDTMEKYFGNPDEDPFLYLEPEDHFDLLMNISADKLSVQCDKVLRLCYARGMTNEEVAKEMNLSEKTVANLKVRAKKQLKIEALKLRVNYFISLIFML
jgi:RNA polymerase sigma factor (sigma-70 family)